MHDLQTFQPAVNTLCHRPLVVHSRPLDGNDGHTISDFTSVSLNIFPASKIVCKRWAAKVLIFINKRQISPLFSNIVAHITLACGPIVMLKCVLAFFWATRALLNIHIL